MTTKLLTTPPDERMSLPDLLRLLRRALLPTAAVEQSTGTWTPTDASGAALTLTLDQTGIYTRHGNLVTATFAITYPATADGTNTQIGGLPFAAIAAHNAAFGGMIGYTTYGAALTVAVRVDTSTLELYSIAGVNLTNANLSGKVLRATVIYEAVP